MRSGTKEFETRIASESPLRSFMKDIRRYPRLSNEKEIELVRLFQETGDRRARELLVLHNLKLVYFVAVRHSWSNVELTDLLQEGSIGILTAVEKFDESLGFAFRTYAAWWVRGTIGRAIVDKGSLIRVPAHVRDSVRKLAEVEDEIAIREGRPATVNEVALSLNKTREFVESVRDAARMSFTSFDEPIELARKSESASGEEPTLAGILADSSVLSPDQMMVAKQELAQARLRVNKLCEALRENHAISDKSKKVFEQYYGLDGSFQKRTMESIAKDYRITREAIRRTLGRSWRRLRRAKLEINEENISIEFDRIRTLEELVSG